MSYIILVKEQTLGSISFIDRNKVKKDELDKECYFKEYHSATSAMSSQSKKLSGSKLNYKINVVPLESIVSRIPLKKVKEILSDLDSIEDLL